MSESTASRIDRAGREQRREERQRATSASSNLVSSSSSLVPLNSQRASFVDRETKNSSDSLHSDKNENRSEEHHITTSTLPSGNKKELSKF